MAGEHAGGGIADGDNRNRPPQGLREVVTELVHRYHPERVVLFGSYAYGEPRIDSDIDLLVVGGNAPSRHQVWQTAHELGCRLQAPLQLVLMGSQEYEETKHIIGGLAYPAHRWGLVLYDAQS